MTDVALIKDCGLYPSYKKIIDFTGTKEQIIIKQLAWIFDYEHTDYSDVNYNKFQNKLVLPMDYSEALTYTYAVLQNITGTDGNPQFFFVNEVENLTNGIDESEPSVAFYLSLDPIMTYMGEWSIDECMVDREHVDRWNYGTNPIRITPNQEGVTAFNKTVQSLKLESDLPENLALCVITFTSPYLKFDFDSPSGFVYEWSETDKEMENAIYYGCFLVDLNDYSRQVKTKIKGTYHGKTDDVNITSNATGIAKFPSLNQVIDGDFQANAPIVDNAIISFTLTPASFMDISYEYDNTLNEYVYTFGNTPNQSFYVSQNNIHADQDVEINELGWLELTTDVVHYEIGASSVISLDDKLVVVFKNIRDISSDYRTVTVASNKWLLPTKPTDGVMNSSIYEPALYMQPYITRRIVKGDGTSILDIPDFDYLDNTITLRTIVTANGISTVFVHGSEGIINASEGEIAVDNSVILDVLNDQWKEYVYTKRDTDRQIVSNYAWKNAIDNLIYMSYGGALVGSRSAGEEGYFTRTPVQRTQNRVNGRFAPGFTETGGNLVPSATGKRVLGAIGLAGAASIVTSLVDAHTSWANQMQKEKQIRNEPSNLLNIGDGIETVLAGYKDYYYVTQKVDDINYERAYQNFRKYGYLVNKFEIPDINSRKYFNYILTNGAIINGSINQAIRDVIASIFDAGVTIFHYDSGDTKTRKLEYTDKENIEVSLI